MQINFSRFDRGLFLNHSRFRQRKDPSPLPYLVLAPISPSYALIKTRPMSLWVLARQNTFTFQRHSLPSERRLCRCS
jgi:hypothetical protein